MKVTLARKLGLLHLLLALGTLGALSIYYLLLQQADASLVAILTRFSQDCERLHKFSDQSPSSNPDAQIVSHALSVFPSLLDTLEKGGWADGRFSTSPAEIRERMPAARAAWDFAKPILARLLSHPPETAERAAEHKLLHPAVPQFQTEVDHILQSAQDRVRTLQTSMRYTLTLVAVSNAIFLIVGVWYARRAIVRPIRLVQEGASRLGAGDFWHRVPLVSRDETAALANSFNSMAESLQQLLAETRRADEELRASEERYRSLFENSNDAIGVSCDDKFAYVNQAWAIMFGRLDPASFIGESIYTHIAPAYRELTRQRRARRIQGLPEPSIYESKGLRADGTEFDSEVRASHYRLGDRLYTLAILRDVTQEKRAGEEAVRQAQELARSNADLQEFAYVTSHDLQEPLRIIGSYAQLLQKRYEGRLDSDADEFIGYMVGGTRRMSSLIRDLLAYSRIVNAESIPLATVDMSQVINWALMNLQAAIQESGAVITRDELPYVRGYHVQLVQLVQNLVGNGIKYRGDERPAIHIGARRSGEVWTFLIKDNGIGIEPRFFDRIFGVFKRLHGAAYPGTGIGLAICKKIVDKHGQKIWVESTPGEGSTFGFTMQAAEENSLKRTAIAGPSA